MTLDQILAAADKTLEIARSVGLDNVENDECPAGNYGHLVDMRERMNAPDFSIGKANRWLGWMQGIVYMAANGDVDLEDLKEVNRYAAHGAGE